MTYESAQLTAEEQKRRKDAVLKAEKIAERLGFRRSIDGIGIWWHEDIGPHLKFPFSEQFNPIASVADLLVVLSNHSRQSGADEVRRSIRKALSL